MAITLADFNKIWASTSPLTPYSFSEANYKQGWNFIGATPPARQMWDFLQKNNDEKMQYIVNDICVPTEIDETSASGDYYFYPVPTEKVFANFTTLGGKTIAWNQLVDSGTSSVTLINEHKYYVLKGTASIQTGSGSAISVTGGTDKVSDLTLMFGSGNEPSAVADFQALFPNYASMAYNAGTLLSAGIKEVISKDSSNNVVATIPIPSAVQSLDGYGWSAGSVYNYIDFARKKFVKRVGAVDLGSLTWVYKSGGIDATDYTSYFYTEFSPANNVTQSVCGKYVKGSETPSGGIYPHEDKTFTFVKFHYAGEINVFDSGYTSASAFKTAMSGVMLYYELATPIETDISSILGAVGIACGNTLTFNYDTNYRLPVPVSMDLLDGTNGLMTPQDKAKLDMMYNSMDGLTELASDGANYLSNYVLLCEAEQTSSGTVITNTTTFVPSDYKKFKLVSYISSREMSNTCIVDTQTLLTLKPSVGLQYGAVTYISATEYANARITESYGIYNIYCAAVCSGSNKAVARIYGLK